MKVYVSFSFSNRTTIAAVSTTHWAEIMIGRHEDVTIKAWSPQNALELLKSQSHEKFNRGTRWLRMYIKHYREMFGKPNSSEWSKEAWLQLTQFVSSVSGNSLEGVMIYLLPTDPLKGLLECVIRHPMCLSQVGFVLIDSGEVQLEDSEAILPECREANVHLQMEFTHITLPGDGGDATIRERKDAVCRLTCSDGRGNNIIILRETNTLYRLGT